MHRCHVSVPKCGGGRGSSTMPCTQCRYWAHARRSRDTAPESKTNKIFACPRCKESKRAPKEGEKASHESEVAGAVLKDDQVCEAVRNLCYLGDVSSPEGGADW